VGLYGLFGFVRVNMWIILFYRYRVGGLYYYIGVGEGYIVISVYNMWVIMVSQYMLCGLYCYLGI
jgi:hypothetical protein